MPEAETSSTCPMCRRCELADTGQRERLREILDRWAAVIGPNAAASFTAEYDTQSNLELILLRCPVCGFGRFSPAIAGTDDFYEAISHTNYYTPDKWEFAQAVRDLTALGSGRVLDVGCGSGHFLRQLRAACPNMSLAGQDTNETLLVGLAAEGFETLMGPIETLSARAGGLVLFDAICLFQVLEHVADPLAFIDGLVALLKPGGTMVITTPNATGPIRLLPEALTELPPHHLTQWTEAAFRSVLPRYGLELLLVRYEPLPAYLWDTYLPLVWSDGIWPAVLFDPLARSQRLDTPQARLGYGSTQLRALGFTRLYGVPGHTLYVIAQYRSPPGDRDAAAKGH